MSLRVQRSEWFIGDLEHYAAWYDEEGGPDLSGRYLQAVASTLEQLANLPTLGHVTHFKAPELRDLRCVQVQRPFEKHLIFYRYGAAFMQNVRFTARETCHGG